MAVAVMTRDDAVRAAAEALADLREQHLASGYLSAPPLPRLAAAAVDAAAPHLTADLEAENRELREGLAHNLAREEKETADLVRERDEALAEVERARREADYEAGGWDAHDKILARAERAEAAIARVVEALCRESSVHGVTARYPVVHVNAVLAALWGDQP